MVAVFYSVVGAALVAALVFVLALIWLNSRPRPDEPAPFAEPYGDL